MKNQQESVKCPSYAITLFPSARKKPIAKPKKVNTQVQSKGNQNMKCETRGRKGGEERGRRKREEGRTKKKKQEGRKKGGKR